MDGEKHKSSEKPTEVSDFKHVSLVRPGRGLHLKHVRHHASFSWDEDTACAVILAHWRHCLDAGDWWLGRDLKGKIYTV